MIKIIFEQKSRDFIANDNNNDKNDFKNLEQNLLMFNNQVTIK